jgi:hypothetical protein
MRKGIEVRLGPGDREQLGGVIGSGNSPQKHVWRARIVLLSTAGIGTMAIQRQTSKGKPTIWRRRRNPHYSAASRCLFPASASDLAIKTSNDRL